MVRVKALNSDGVGNCSLSLLGEEGMEKMSSGSVCWYCFCVFVSFHFLFVLFRFSHLAFFFFLISLLKSTGISQGPVRVTT